MLPPENEDEARRLVNEMLGYYHEMFQSFYEDDHFYEGSLDELDDLALPEGFHLIIPTTARAIIDEAVDNIEPYELSITYTPRNFGKQPEQDAEKIQRFLRNLWYFWRQRAYDIDPMRDFMKNLFKNGKGVLKIIPDWSLWPDLSEEEEERLYEQGDDPDKFKKMIGNIRNHNFPVTVRSMPPTHIMEDPSLDARKLWVIERYEMSIEEVRNRWAEYIPTLKMYNPDYYDVHEVWTASWIDWDGNFKQGKHWILVNGERVLEEDNEYHEIPYVIKYSGFGRETFDGTPRLKATGFFSRQVKSQLVAEARRLSQFDAIMSQLAFPIAFLPEGVDDIDLDFSPGGLNFVPDSVLENFDKIFLQADIPDAEYLNSIQSIQQQIERGTTQKAIRGAGVPGTDSASQLEMITNQAKLRIQPVKRVSENTVDEVNALILKFVENIFEESVSVFAAEPNSTDTMYTLRPKEIKGKYSTKTVFMPNEEQVKERKLMLAAEARGKGMNSFDAYQFAGFDNPYEMVERDLAYELMQDENIKKFLAEKALEKWGVDYKEVKTEQMMEDAMMQSTLRDFANAIQSGSAPGTGAAPGGGNPQQGGQQGQQQGQGQQSAPSPQVQGRPTETPNPGEGVNQVRRQARQI